MQFMKAKIYEQPLRYWSNHRKSSINIWRRFQWLIILFIEYFHSFFSSVHSSGVWSDIQQQQREVDNLQVDKIISWCSCWLGRRNLCRQVHHASKCSCLQSKLFSWVTKPLVLLESAQHSSLRIHHVHSHSPGWWWQCLWGPGKPEQ